MPRQAPPPELSNILFPELPVSKTAKVKPPVKGNASFRNIVGDTTPLKPAWAASNALAGDGGQRGVASENGRDPEGKIAETGKSKKAKGKQKQMLFTLGTYPVWTDHKFKLRNVHSDFFSWTSPMFTHKFYMCWITCIRIKMQLQVLHSHSVSERLESTSISSVFDSLLMLATFP
jgi:hypothetical protein